MKTLRTDVKLGKNEKNSFKQALNQANCQQSHIKA